MKLLTIILDATGALHIEATRAPDLRRREISQETGCAEILFCAAPPAGKSAHDIAVELEGVLASRTGTRDGSAKFHIQRAALWHIHLKPALSQMGRRVRRRVFSLFRIQPVPQVTYRMR